MKFAEFFKLHEATVRGIRNYIVTKLNNGQFSIKLLRTPDNEWVAQIVNGVLVLPPELEPHREDILAAYFNRYPGFGSTGNTTGSLNIKNDSDVIKPQQSEPTQNTFAFKPTAPKQRV
jgi:hypothetical protein